MSATARRCAARPARILYLTPTPPDDILWGTELLLLDLIDSLDADRYRRLAAVVQNDGVVADALRERGIRVLRTRLAPPSPFGPQAVMNEARMVRDCIGELGDDRPDLVHVNNAWAGRTGVMLGLWYGVPTVMQLHGRPRSRQYFTYGAALSDVVLANSRFTAQGWQWWPASTRVQVVYPGVDLSRFRPSPADRASARRQLDISEDTFVIGCLGRGTPEKGHRYLLEALAGLRERGCAIKLVMIGLPPPGNDHALYPHLEHLHRLVVDLRIDKSVRFLGFQTETPRWLNALDVLVHPSLRESFGRAAAEAMAVGLPVIASRVDGLPEIVADAETGLLVPPADPPGLRAAVARLHADRELRRQMGERGRRRVQQLFSRDRYLREMEAVYEGALCRRRSPTVGPMGADVAPRSAS